MVLSHSSASQMGKLRHGKAEDEWEDRAPQRFQSQFSTTVLRWVLAGPPQLPAPEGSSHPPGIFLEANLFGDGEGQDEQEGGDADGELAVCVPAAAPNFLRLLHQSSNDCRDNQDGQVGPSS